MWAHGLQGGRPEQGSHGERAGRGLPRATRSRWGALACARQHLPSRSGSRGCRGRPQQRLMQDPGLARWQWGWTQGVLMGWRRRRERDRQGGVPRRGPTWAGSWGWAQQLAAGVPRSVSLGKERRPLNRPAFQRPCRSGKCQEPAADEQRWGRPLGLGHLRQRRSERPRGRPRGRRPPTRVRAEWTQTGCVPTAPPSCWQ